MKDMELDEILAYSFLEDQTSPDRLESAALRSTKWQWEEAVIRSASMQAIVCRDVY